MALLPTAQSLHPEGTGGGGGGKLLSSSESFPLEKTTRRAFGSRSFWGWAKTGRLPAAACKQAEGKEVGGEGGVETRARRRGHLPWNDPCSPAPCPPPRPPVPRLGAHTAHHASAALLRAPGPGRRVPSGSDGS